MAAMATSGASDLLRGWPCWSTTVSRTVRSSRSRISLATAAAAAGCLAVDRPDRSTNPAWPTPVTRTALARDESGEEYPIWLASDQGLALLARGATPGPPLGQGPV